MTNKLKMWLIALIFLNGYVSLSMELLALRQISFFVGSSAIVTSIIIGIFLCFMSIGYFKGSNIKSSKIKIKKTMALSFTAIAIMTILATSFTLVINYFNIMYAFGIHSSVIQTFIYSLFFLSIAPFLFGFNTSMLSKYLNRYNRNSTGSIMAWDTIGSVLGSLATTLILMPFIGVNYTILLVVILSLIGVILARYKLSTLILFPVILIPAYLINSNTHLKENHNIIANNANSTIGIYGNMNEKMLVMNGLPMSIYKPATRTSAEYIDYINDNFLYTMPQDKKHNILILGAGGFTAGIKDDFNNYTFVDIEAKLKQISEDYFLNEKLGTNKKFIVQDASQFLKNTDEKYDFILLDVYSNSYQVPEDFITEEFMQRIKSTVATNGIIAMNILSSPSYSDTYTKVFDNTFNTVFPHNTNRQVVGNFNPWLKNSMSNIIYIYYNKSNSGKTYTINKNPVIYDR